MDDRGSLGPDSDQNSGQKKDRKYSESQAKATSGIINRSGRKDRKFSGAAEEFALN